MPQIIQAQLTRNFNLEEFLKLTTHPDNVPSMQVVCNIQYGVTAILQPLRDALGCPIIINSGYRNPAYNESVGGVKNSQHLRGCAADIRPSEPKMFEDMLHVLQHDFNVDQLLGGKGWCHVSWTPIGIPRHDFRVNFYDH